MSFENWLQKKDTNMFYEFFVEAKKDKKWIQKLDIKKGRFTNYCGGEVTNDCIEKALKSDDAHVVKMANLAKTFRKIGKKKHRM